jgi:formylglycine-generating enzyme required for sulfatase activity
LSEKEGKTYRLPTEAEWEYACRGGATTAFSFGNDADSLQDYAWFDENASDGSESFAHEVGTKKGNLFGLNDMHGNVREWCNDWYRDYHHFYSAEVDPRGPLKGSLRVLRGGGSSSKARFCRTAVRNSNDPSYRDCNLGFRLALNPPGQ